MATTPKHPLATIALAAIAPVWFAAPGSQVYRNKSLPTLVSPQLGCDREARCWAFLSDSADDDEAQIPRGGSVVGADIPATPPSPRVRPVRSGSRQSPLQTTRVIATAPKHGPPKQFLQ